MGMLIVAEPRAAFEHWRDQSDRGGFDRRRRRAQVRRAGVFLQPLRDVPHRAGHQAGGRVGPDLTHVGSRRYIAAGTLRRPAVISQRGSSIHSASSPGANMPIIKVPPQDLNALAHYLEGLK